MSTPSCGGRNSCSCFSSASIGRRVKLTGLDDFNVAIAELSQTEAVVSSLVLGYMFLGDKIERMVRGK